MTEFELESSLNLAWHWARTLEYSCVQNLILSKPKQCEQSMKRISLPDSLSYCSISCCLKWLKGLTLSQSANICTKTCFSFLSFHKKVLLHIHCIVLSGVNLSRATITATASLSDHHAILSSQLPESLCWDLRPSRQCVQRNIFLLITFWGVFGWLLLVTVV